MLDSSLSLQKDSEQDNGHSSDLDQRKSGILSCEDCPQGEWDRMTKNDGDTGRKRTPSLLSHESTVQRSAQEQRWWKIVDPLFCQPGHDFNCFSQIVL